MMEVEKTNFEDGKNREFKIHRKVNGDVMDVVRFYFFSLFVVGFLIT